MKGRILIFALIFIVLVPHTVMAEDIHQKVEVTITPKSGNYTKMFNIVDANNSWLDNRKIWEDFRTDGRIVGEGIIPNPVEIHDYENDSGTAKMSVISVKYLDTYDIMSGTSDSYIRLPLAVNTSSYSENITMRIKLYAIEGNTYNITDFNYTDVSYSTYASSYLLYSSEGNMSSLSDVYAQKYSYPSNITNLSIELFYLHVRGPIIAKSTYILLQYIEIPDAKSNPFYLLSTYTNSTGYYYASGQIRSVDGAPSWSMLARYGMSEDVYSTNIPSNHYYYYESSEDLSVSASQKVYVSFAIPAYSSKDDLKLRVVLTAYENNYQYAYQHIVIKKLEKGINNIFINYSFTASADGTIDKFAIGLNSTQGDDVYFYLVRDSKEKLSDATKGRIFYHASALLNYHLISKTQYISFQQFNFEGLQEPIIKYNVKYVYSLLDFPILIYKFNTMMLTNAIYFLTFGKVDLRYLYSDDFILKMAQGIKNGWEAFLDMIRNSPIGLFIKTVIDFVVNSAAWWGNWLLQFGLFILNIAAYALFLWPWIVFARGLIALQEQGVDAMLDYYASYVDRITSLMSKFLVRKGVG